MIIIPAPGFLLIELLKDDGKTTQGIYLPQDQKQEPVRAKVIAIGDLRQTEDGTKMPLPSFNNAFIQTSDIIYFKQHTQTELPGYNETQLAFIPFEVVMGMEY